MVLLILPREQDDRDVQFRLAKCYVQESPDSRPRTTFTPKFRGARMRGNKQGTEGNLRRVPFDGTQGCSSSLSLRVEELSKVEGKALVVQKGNLADTDFE